MLCLTLLCVNNDHVSGCSSRRSLVVCVKLTALLYSFIQSTAWWEVFLLLFYVQNLNAIFFLSSLFKGGFSGASLLVTYWCNEIQAILLQKVVYI